MNNLISDLLKSAAPALRDGPWEGARKRVPPEANRTWSKPKYAVSKVDDQ